MTAKRPESSETDNLGLYGGAVLGLAAVAALTVANSPFGPHYEALLGTLPFDDEAVLKQVRLGVLIASLPASSPL